ncbi:DNA polymerase-like [Canna indica]|uniref:DNA-directed DNA polymerase n=1 Tax=Canna indica TaxID=4628 RepID=A0AAQ3QR35_9LILI|nr:DNA polymerase-like [Canna indica]
MDLLIQFAYPVISGYAKFTICLTMKIAYGADISFTLGFAIPLTYGDNNDLIPGGVVYSHIFTQIKRYMEKYNGSSIIRVAIKVYMSENKMMGKAVPSKDEIYISLSAIINIGLSDTDPGKAKQIKNSKRNYSNHITAYSPSRTEMKPFIVADTQTIYHNNIHKPYAIGLLLVRPGSILDNETHIMIETYFSEDDSIIMDSFEERSAKVLYDLVTRINTLVKQEQTPLTIYFHNFSRFDGILLLKHLILHHKNYTQTNDEEQSSLRGCSIFWYEDFIPLQRLIESTSSLCPELGTKGSIPYDEITLENLPEMKTRLIDYMKQDILLLGGIMKNAQENYWMQFQIDIESKITISSLSLNIFRMKFYDDQNWPIHIPNKNEDSFIRRAYYEFPMPGGVPKWESDLEGQDLENLFGFIEAYVICPKTINKRFLPYRDNKTNTLIFPTSEFIGVYYSEELKYARRLGYTVIPISGYLFEKKESPFKDFVLTLYNNRLLAKKTGNESLSFIYKILMNTLYGRFGINPKSTKTIICDNKKYIDLLMNTDFIYADEICENQFIVAYHTNTESGGDQWDPPKNAAIQLAAAITANARIYMYPFISREDCYYTDTDSVILGKPLPNDMISTNTLGMFKLEDQIVKGYF